MSVGGMDLAGDGVLMELTGTPALAVRRGQDDLRCFVWVPVVSGKVRQEV